ncbi:hypothetical protein WJX77_007957 [Trebouxia sp. C0004]
MAATAASQALQRRSAYFPGDSEGDASSRTTVNTSASQPRRRQDAAPPSSHSDSVINRVSFASAYRHKSAQVQSSSAVRAWRFPSSRRFLWDRTATGPCVHLHPQAFLPAVILKQQAFKSLQEQTGAAKQLHVPAAWHVGVSNAVSLAVGAGPSELAEATFSLPIAPGQKELHECCFGDSALELAQHLTAAVKSGLNVRAPASMQQVYSVSCHSNAAQLHCQVAVPGSSVLLTPLYAKKVCQVPLSQSLQDGQQQATVKASQNGLLSMDQARSLLPLLADDPNAYGVPLVGVWVSGVASPTHPLVWLACLKFFATTQLQDKVMQGDRAFLLLLYAAGSHPSCYEVRVDAPSQKMPVLSLRCAASRPGKGDAVCSLVPMRHADNSIDVGQGHSSKEAAEASRPSSSQSWRSPSLSKDMDQLAPRRQSLPVPHASPAFVPAWAPQAPDTHSPDRPHHVDTQTCGSGYVPAEQSDSYRYDGTHATGSLAAWFQSAAQQSSQTSPSTAAHHYCSPGRESLQAAPSVNITITGACSCQSPVKPYASVSLQDPMRSADRQNSAVLNPEASLAHLHQPAAPAGEAVRKASRAMQSSAGVEEDGRAGPEGDAQGRQQAAEAGIDTAALQKEVTDLRQQLQRLMLQMAANAAAPPARPSRTAETSTSTLWAPGAALLHRQPSSFLQHSSLPDSQQQQQQEQSTQLQASLSGAPDSGNEPGAQHAQHESQPASSAAPSEVHAAEDPDAVSIESHERTSVQNHSAGAPCSIVSHSMQQPSQHASHRDGHQPWASQWAQPALPALAVPTAQLRLGMPLDHQQHRRATAADVPVSRTLQQTMRNSSGLQAARSLSWSQPAAADSPHASQPSSDVRSSVAGSLLMHQIEPATPPASFQREDSGAGAGQQTTIAWEGYPQVGAQWGFKQETIQVGTVTADSHMPINLSQVTNQDQQSSAPMPSDRSEALQGGAELDSLAAPSVQEGAPLLLTSASPQKPLQHRAGTASRAASAASSLAANSMLLSGSGTGLMTVVRTHFVPLGDSLSDSDSDSEDIRLEQKYGIIRGCRQKSSMAVSHRDSSSSFLPDMSLDSRMYLHMRGVWQPSMNSLAASEDLHPD